MVITKLKQHKYNAPEVLPKQVTGKFTVDVAQLITHWTISRTLVASRDASPERKKQEQAAQQGLALQQKMSQEYPLPWMMWLFNFMGGYFTPEENKHDKS